jgi:signal transduction histidine kinase
MTIRTRLTLWYTAILSLSLFLLSAALYYELVIEPRTNSSRGKNEAVETEIDELIFLYELPVLAIAVLGGWWLMKKALAPVAAITEATASINAQNLRQQLPLSGSGDEVDRLAEVINSMLRRLDQSFARERDFTLHASHELKTPLTVMRAQTETFLREKDLRPDHRHMLEELLEEIARLAAILESLSFLATADAGLLNLRKNPLRLDELVRDTFEDTLILARSRNIKASLETCEAITIEADKTRIRQLLMNVADNSIKHNEEGGTVRYLLENVNGCAQLTIINSGHGIAPADLPRVFDRFFRGDPAHNPNLPGSGLGLSIAQSIIQAHGGTISLASSPGEFTTMKLRFPVM